MTGCIDILAASDRPHIRGPLVVDTETSGLYADDGARVSVVSMAFEVRGNDVDSWEGAGFQVRNTDWVPLSEPAHGMHNRAWVAFCALPFDQGISGKPDDHGQLELWSSSAANLQAQDWQRLLFVLKTHPGGLVFQNAKFDLEKLRVGVREERWSWNQSSNRSWGAGVELENAVVWDTALASQEIWPRHSASLDATAKRLFGVGKEGADVIKQFLKQHKLAPGRYDLVPWEVMEPYAGRDAIATWQIWRWQRELVETGMLTEQKRENIQRALDVMRVLYHMERRGLPYDAVYSLKMLKKLDERARGAENELPFYPPTLASAKKFFFGNEDEWKSVAKRGRIGPEMAPYSVTEKGSPQLTAEIVDRMVADGVEHAATWSRYQKISTASSMWYRGYADAIGPDGRLRTYFRQYGTASSRFSVERVNLQAIPHDYRLSGYESLSGLLTPRQLVAAAVIKDMPNWSLWEMDLEQAELRVAALWAACGPMLLAISQGRDLHGETAQSLFNVDQNHPDWSHYRQIGKRGNFTLCFGAGPKTFRAMVAKETGVILSEAEARRIVNEWNDLYPEYKEAIRRHTNVVEDRIHKFGFGWLTLAGGARRYFSPGEETHKAFNQRVQGSLAQYGIRWMIATDRYLMGTDIDERARRDKIGEAGLLLVIHDSQVVLLPKDEEQTHLRECKDLGLAQWKEWFGDEKSGVPGGIDAKKW